MEAWDEFQQMFHKALREGEWDKHSNGECRKSKVHLLNWFEKKILIGLEIEMVGARWSPEIVLSWLPTTWRTWIVVC